MSAALVLPPVPVQQEGPRRKRFTRAEYEELIDSGFFAGQRCELVNGELIDKIGQDPPHAEAVTFLLSRLAAAFGRRVRCQVPVDLRSRRQARSLRSRGRD